MTERKYEVGTIVNAMLVSAMAGHAPGAFRRAYENWEKSGRSREVYDRTSPTPGLPVVTRVLSPYQELIAAANELYTARTHFNTLLPKEIRENDAVKRVLEENLSREGKKLDELIELGVLAPRLTI